jgi:sphingomyelin phosphodiesterase acid-like 3
VNVPEHPDVRLVVLNSVLFSTKSLSSQSQRAANAQLDWLQQQLQQAVNQKQKILIALHIPETVDVYATHFFRLFTFQEFWKTEFVGRFNSEIAAFAPSIIGIFSGHLHYDWMQKLAVDKHHSLPVITVPSISPVYGNDPAFKLYHFADDRIDNYTTYTYSIKSDSWSVTHSDRLEN